MKTVQLHEAKARLSELVEAASKGEEFVITRYGTPIARLVGEGVPSTRELGFYPIEFQSDLLAPTDPEILALFEPAE